MKSVPGLTGWLSTGTPSLGEAASFIYNFYDKVAAHKIVYADLSLKHTDTQVAGTSIRKLLISC